MQGLRSLFLEVDPDGNHTLEIHVSKRYLRPLLIFQSKLDNFCQQLHPAKHASRIIHGQFVCQRDFPDFVLPVVRIHGLYFRGCFTLVAVSSLETVVPLVVGRVFRNSLTYGAWLLNAFSSVNLRETNHAQCLHVLVMVHLLQPHKVVL